jgi:hypothetical protein
MMPRNLFGFFNKNSAPVFKYGATINLFSLPFGVTVETLPAEFHVEVTGLQC